MFEAFTAMEACLSFRYGGTDAPYIKEAMDDLLQSSESVLLRGPNYGQSNWASLQATEKVIKSYILEKGGIPAKIHKLSELIEHASQLGLPAIGHSLIQAIQCDPNVRYDSALVTKHNALAAHEAALMICGTAAKLMKRSTATAAVRKVQMHINPDVRVGALMLEYHPASPPFFH
jgi:hypothetical protein